MSPEFDMIVLRIKFTKHFKSSLQHFILQKNIRKYGSTFYIGIAMAILAHEKT